MYEGINVCVFVRSWCHGQSTAQAESTDRAPVGEGRKKSPSPRKPSQFLKVQNKEGQNHPPDASEGRRALGLWSFKERKRGQMLGREVLFLSGERRNRRCVA